MVLAYPYGAGPRLGRMLIVAIAALGFGMTQALAADFMLHNDSDYVIVSFQATIGGGWSDNWMRRDVLRPGESAAMEAINYTGPCNVRFRVRSNDNFVHEYNGNFCKISNLYIHNEDASWD